MTWSAKDADDFVFKLEELLGLYGRKLETNHIRFWTEALNQKPIALVLKALGEYSRTGKYAPKPVDVIEIVDTLRAKQRSFEKPEQDEPQRRDPLVARAWVTYLRFAHGFEMPGQGGSEPMPIDQALEIVNREAAKYDRPDSILPEHRIAEFWSGAAA